MLFPTSPLSQAVIQALSLRSMKGPEIIAHIDKQYPGITRQAVYQALRVLLKEELVIKNNTFFEINRLWAYKLRSLSDSILGPASVSSSVITSMQEGDRLSYYFKDIYQSDIVWGNIADILLDNLGSEVPIVMYFPHEWFLIAREKSESQLFRRYGEVEKTLLIAIGGQTPLDTLVQKEWNGEYVHVNTGTKYNFKENYYLNIYGDYIIEVTTPLTISNALEVVYRSTKVITPVIRNEITRIVQQPHRTKFLLSKNKKRAEMLRKKTAKDFILN